MNTYDGLVNDYLRAVEQALAGVPASRRDELLSDLSQHIAAKRAELAPDQETEVEVRSILELLGDPEDVAAEAMIDTEPEPPIVIQPGKRLGAVAWVAITIAAVSTMCVVTGLIGVLFFARADTGGPKEPVPNVSLVPTAPSIQPPTPSPS
jgi:uncharacterized membrane protein